MSLPTDPLLLANITDVHCHPTESDYSDSDVRECPIKLYAMATNAQDQLLVKQLARRHPDTVVPCFGEHPDTQFYLDSNRHCPRKAIIPGFPHCIAIHPVSTKDAHYRSLFLNDNSSSQDRDAFNELLPSLPEPLLLQDLLVALESDLNEFPTSMLGEVGLDRSVRVRFDSDSNPKARRLSPFKIPIDHQIQILEAQLALAVRLKRHVSLHSVNAQSITLNLLDRMDKTYGDAWLQISIDIHSCTLSSEMWNAMEVSLGK